MRKKLSDKNSDEYLAFIGDKSLFDREKLISLIILRKSVDVSREAIREVSIPFPAEPDEEATLEEQEKYQAAVDNYAKELNEKVSEYVRSKLDEEKRKLESLPDDELFKIYEEAQINGICEEEMVKTYRQYCAYFGTYKDKKFTKRMFSSYEEFDN
ncbi:MAG: hypothetical protein N2712_08130, partial [Brevinematales bacterium]|nr:hypothetical protein [Brevinematales bacterium]